MAKDWTSDETEEYISTLTEMEMPREKLQQYYDDWAPKYDQTVAVRRYVGPAVSAKVFQKFVASKNARILDVAAGTGLVGEELRKFGFDNIDAIDGSSKILEEARRKNIYINLQFEWIEGGKRLNIDDEAYDAIISAGSFYPNALGSDCFPELIRVVKSGGIIVISTRCRWVTDGKLEADMKKVETEGKWKLIEKSIHKAEESLLDMANFVLQVC